MAEKEEKIEEPQKKFAPIKRQVKKRSSKKSATIWLIKVFVLALSLGIMFSALSELVLSKSGIIVSSFVILFFLVVSIIADIVGVAVTASEDSSFNAMASKKVRGAKEALFLIRNSDKVASFMCDIVGDICGILSGSAAAAIVLKIISNGSTLQTIISIVATSLIASLTIFGKAVGKNYAIKNNEKIVFGFAKFISIFTKQNKK